MKLKLLLGPDGNAEEVNEGAALLRRSLDEFVGVHESIQMLLSEELKEQETSSAFSCTA